MKNNTEKKKKNIEWNSQNKQHVPKILLQLKTPALLDTNNHLVMKQLPTVKAKPVESMVVFNDISETEQIPKESAVEHSLTLSEAIEDFDGVSCIGYKLLPTLR